MADKTERELLKERADQMELVYEANVPTSKLKGMIAEALGQSNSLDTLDADEQRAKDMVTFKMHMNELVRIRLTCMNQDKKDWPGEIITVGNDIIGTVKKFVPFSASEGWHIPRAILGVLQEREYQLFYTTRGANGQPMTRTKLAKEFAIEILPNLSQDEINAVQASSQPTSEDANMDQHPGGR